jgi:hypothetical protein
LFKILKNVPILKIREKEKSGQNMDKRDEKPTKKSPKPTQETNIKN